MSDKVKVPTNITLNKRLKALVLSQIAHRKAERKSGPAPARDLSDLIEKLLVAHLRSKGAALPPELIVK